VRLIRLGKGDIVIAAEVAKKDALNDASGNYANGYGKRTALKEYKIQKRGGSGIKTAKITQRRSTYRFASGDAEDINSWQFQKRASHSNELQQIPDLDGRHRECGL